MPQPLCRSLKDLFDLSRVGIEGNLDLYRGYVVEDVKLDTIAREELCRSVATFGVSLIATAFVITAGYLPIPAFLIFPLPLTIAAVVAYVLVWYRRKEGLIDPNPIRILHHVLQSGEQQEERAKRRRTLADKVTDGVLAVAIFLIYLYASRAYSINQILWLPVLLIIGMFLARIVFTDGGGVASPSRISCLLPRLPGSSFATWRAGTSLSRSPGSYSSAPSFPSSTSGNAAWAGVAD